MKRKRRKEKRNKMASLLKIIEEKKSTETSLPSYIVKRISEDNVEENPKKERDDRPYILRVYVGEKINGSYPVFLDTSFTYGFCREHIFKGAREELEDAKVLAYSEIKFYAQILSDEFKIRLLE